MTISKQTAYKIYMDIRATGAYPHLLTCKELEDLRKIYGWDVNGCGACSWQSYFLTKPFWLGGVSLRKACNRHDSLYAIGGVEEDRIAADRQFRMDIDSICRRRFSWLWRIGIRYGSLTSSAYYRVVRDEGRKHFNYM